MAQIHTSEKEQFAKLFKQDHIDRFEDRFNVLEVFLQTERHVTVSELVESLEENGYSYSPDFVMETLKLMYRYGFADKYRFDNRQLRYEHRHLGQHHDHMICTKCRRIVEFSDSQLEQLQLRIAVNHGFHMLQHKMELYGICQKCMHSRAQLIPLALAKQGEHLVIDDFSGGPNSRLRLLSMGLRPRDAIEVITNTDRGQVVISADGKRYALGRGLAKKIMVRPDDHRKSAG